MMFTMNMQNSNNQHRFKDINSRSKCVRMFATPDSNRCVVRLLDTYISKLPTSPRAFYLRPPPSVSSSGPWYGQAVVGVNTLKNMPELCKEACLGIQYALRATAITCMYEGGLPEISSGRSPGIEALRALCAYERTSILQEKAAGAIN